MKAGIRTIQQVEIESFRFDPDGGFPNNPRLPLVVVRRAFETGVTSLSETIERTFVSNGWERPWRNSIYPFHHYHSTAHEVLGVGAGSAELQFGGPNGLVMTLCGGDVLIIPAGVSHKCNSSEDSSFEVVGAYPRGQEWDIMRGLPQERPGADARIDGVALPDRDPVFGDHGPLLRLWTAG